MAPNDMHPSTDPEAGLALGQGVLQLVWEQLASD